MPENNVMPEHKKRDLVYSRMKAKYPDKTFEDDESVFGQIEDDYNEYDNKLSEMQKENEDIKKREKTFSDLFTQNPRSAKFMDEWGKGGDPALAMIREFGPDIIDIINDPDKQEEVAEANQEFAKRVAMEKDYEDKYQKNLQESFAMLEKMDKDGTPPEQIDAAFELLINIGKDMMLGKISPEAMDMALKALNHDTDVASASKEAEIRGRNAQIEEKLRKSKKGDGTMPLGNKGGSMASTPKLNLGVLDNYGDGQKNIWERGGEKRTKQM